MVVSETLLNSPRAWETFLQGATPDELETFHDTLPTNDLGSYRKVCADIFLNNFENALTMLEEGGSLFNDVRYGVGVHVFVRQRLGLAIPYLSPAPTGDDHHKEDSVYWYLGWSLYNAEHKDYREARNLLHKAKTLALELGMSHTLAVIETIKKNLHTPFQGLPLVAPPSSVLRSSKAFDKLRQDESQFKRLGALGREPFLDAISKCRYAQYLLYNDQYQEALALVEEVKPHKHLLAYAIKMKALWCLEKFEELGAMVQRFKPGGASDLEADATILAYECCAIYYTVVRKAYKAAYAYYHRAEALALEHGLTYRLGVIRMNLEAATNMAGESLVLDPLLDADAGDFKTFSIRNRFDSFLRAGNILLIERGIDTGDFTQQDVFLARATLEYHHAQEGTGHMSVVAGLITNQVPEDALRKFYWSLLMLQVFCAIGNADGRADPDRIRDVLKQSLVDLGPYLSSVLPVVAHIYPLGLSLAAHLDVRLANASDHVATLWSESERDGLRRGKERLTSVTKPVREALLLDDLNSTREHFHTVTNKRTGHAQNKARLERSLAKAQLKRSEFTTVAGVYRGLVRLAKTLNDESLLQVSESLREGSSFLKLHGDTFTF
jgi:hypothetical protein